MIAGGIGITPFMAQLEDLHARPVPFELHYSARSPEHAAFLAAPRERESPAACSMYYDSEGQCIDFEALLSKQPLGRMSMSAGPAGFIEQVMDTAPRPAAGRPATSTGNSSARRRPATRSKVTLGSRAGRVTWRPTARLLEAIEAAGVEVPYLCRGGVCGFCQTGVVECDGELLHYDHYLSDADKATRQGDHALRLARPRETPGPRPVTRAIRRWP